MWTVQVHVECWLCGSHDRGEASEEALVLGAYVYEMKQ